MNFVTFGGIQQYGQMLNGWMQYGVLGAEISGIAPVMPVPASDARRGRIPAPDEHFNYLLPVLPVRFGIRPGFVPIARVRRNSDDDDALAAILLN